MAPILLALAGLTILLVFTYNTTGNISSLDSRLSADENVLNALSNDAFVCQFNQASGAPECFSVNQLLAARLGADENILLQHKAVIENHTVRLSRIENFLNQATQGVG